MNQTHIKPDHKTRQKQTKQANIKNIMVNLGCLAGIVVIAYALISTIAVPCGAGEASWNLWGLIGRAAGGIG